MRTLNNSTHAYVAGLLLGATILFVGCCEKCPPADQRDPDRAVAAVSTACANGSTRIRRPKLYTKTELNAQMTVFDDHFKYDPDGPNSGNAEKPIEEQRVRIPWGQLKDAEVIVENEIKRQVRGIYIHYGMDGDRFKPIIQFMYDDGGDSGDLILYKDKYFHLDFASKSFKEIADGPANEFIAAYKNTVVVKRTGGADFSKILTGGGEVDPLAEWFSYPDNVNALYADNSQNNGAPHLVVSCISEDLCYTEMVGLVDPAPTSENRHLLALHISDGTEDLLDTSLPSRYTGYGMKAMDLGHLCPPRCK